MLYRDTSTKMAILHKDGKTYLLEQPNPLVKTQESWDVSKLVFHNFSWEEIRAISESSRKENKQESKKEPKQEPKKAPKQEREPDHSEEETKDEKRPTLPDDGREFDLPLLKYKVLSYCLPARREKRTDALYGDKWDRIKYGEKFTFPSVIISSSDIELEFWTSDPRKQISESSIIYPYSYEVYNKSTESYDKVPYDEYRWWKVSAKERKEEGWLFSAMPSDMQPDFSE